MEPGTYTVEMPGDYPEAEITGEDILMDDSVRVVGPYDRGRIDIYQDGQWAGAGRLDGGEIHGCAAVLAPTGLDHHTGEAQEAAEDAYDAIQAAIERGDDEVTVHGVRYTWQIEHRNDPTTGRQL